MVRINLINPKSLADQHLIAEYDEILMLLGYVKRYPELTDIPKKYCLGKGHIKFFKNKLLYLKQRHELIKNEMRRRTFRTVKTINLSGFSSNLINNWKPNRADKSIIKQRLIEKIRKKPEYYRYFGINKPLKFFVQLIKKA
jgi:deoxyribonuclease (pyrimidine dimer)